MKPCPAINDKDSGNTNKKYKAKIINGKDSIIDHIF